MPNNVGENLIACFNPFPFAAAPGAVGRIGFTATALGNAALVALAGAPVVVAVDLDLVDDEVAIGGPDSANVRRLFRGRDDGGGRNVLETVPILIGAQALALGKVEASPFVAGDVAVPMMVRDSGSGAYQIPVMNSSIAVAGFRLQTFSLPEKGATGTFSVVAVAAASVLVAGASTNRRAITFQNRGPGPISLRNDGAAATAADFRISNGDKHTFSESPNAAWTAISNAAGASLVVLEETY